MNLLLSPLVGSCLVILQHLGPSLMLTKIRWHYHFRSARAQVRALIQPWAQALMQLQMVLRPHIAILLSCHSSSVSLFLNTLCIDCHDVDNISIFHNNDTNMCCSIMKIRCFSFVLEDFDPCLMYRTLRWATLFLIEMLSWCQSMFLVYIRVCH